ncbi:hypothetical protein FDF74_05460 [Clostridium niameyense]|uniref:Tetratricopeptide repeat protein n=1 Tax=Clostridium niameyense TaxID=1622073 RepID=A0A6M0R8U0_9CLOT|nr:tetratricopeptide repeat protein [Clostridium niameyense]NEZ46661.1 hypothetical protein [Clostridium niameyense]
MDTTNKSKKLYFKALELINKGYIDKALDCCEKSIAVDIKNSSAINLKGLLYYLKGDLISAKKLWKMNYSSNKDEIAHKYLNGMKFDEKLLKKYADAVLLKKKSSIREAIDLFKQCEESDFNSINVSNNISECYLKLGKYTDALEYNNKVIAIDKNNECGKNIRKILTKRKVVKSDRKKICKIVVGIILIISVFTSTLMFTFNSEFKNKYLGNIKLKKEPKKVTSKKQVPQNKSKKVENKSIKKESNLKFNADEAKEGLNKKDYNKLYNIYNYWKDKDLNINDKSILIKVEDVLKEEGIQYMYNNALNLLKDNKFKESNECLLKAYSFGYINYLYPHIIYLLGTNYEAMENISEAIKYYEQYDNKFNKDNYEEVVLYKLCILYEKIDNNKSKNYANRLINQYPSSIYNNSNIKRVLNNN